MDKQAFTLQSIALPRSCVFRDAVHNYIHVENQLLVDLINTKEMQRLRRIHQLGGTYQVYQSAEHSRFSHSLGVYQVVKLMCKQNCIGDHLNDYDKLSVQCAALLHDIGHGPFSHCFEDVFGLPHETYTIKIIQEDSQIHHILESFDPGFSKVVSSIIEKTHPNKILIQMVSSQLDGDRMDYLLRDSHFTGTTYGHFDMQRILRVMEVKDGFIVYREGGVQAIENYILARYHMYWQVYYHPTGRSYEQLLISIFRRVQDLYQEGYDFGDIRYLLPFLKKEVNVEEYHMLDEAVVFYYFRIFSQGKDQILKDLTTRFLNRDLFACRDWISEEDFVQTKQKMTSLGYDPRYYVMLDNASQVPYHYYGDTGSIGEIEIRTEEGLLALPDISEIVGAITKSDRSKKDNKIYYPKETSID